MPLPDKKEVGTLYYEYGKDKNKHVLFIHGLGSSSIVWRDIPQALSEHFHTITVDLIGFGGSDKPNTADYTIKGFSKFIVDFLRERIRIKENEKISIVGHSLGGYIAAEVAIENKNLIEKLVLIDSSGMLKEPTPLLKDYRVAAMQEDPVSRYEKVKRYLRICMRVLQGSFRFWLICLITQLKSQAQSMHLNQPSITVHQHSLNLKG